MSKKFYIVIPFYVYEAPSKVGFLQSFKGIFKPDTTVKQIGPESLETYKNQLLQRAELVFDGLIGLGLKTKILEKNDLMNVFYDLYNPGNKLDFSKQQG